MRSIGDVGEEMEVQTHFFVSLTENVWNKSFPKRKWFLLRIQAVGALPCCFKRKNKYLNSFPQKVPEDSKFPSYLGKTIYTNAVSQHTSCKLPPTSVQGHPKNWNARKLGSQPKPLRAVDHGSHTKAVTYEVCGVSAFLLKAVLMQIQ